MKECCENCKFLWNLEDWKDYPRGQYFRPVCGYFFKEKSVMALFNIESDDCEAFTPKEERT